MCGIGGIFSLNYSKTQINSKLNLLTDLQHHRGPDGRKIWMDDNFKVGFAHNRLSIIDTTEKSTQPFVKNNYTIVFNGEIYNYRALRKELISHGYIFETEGDTEVLLNSYINWGKECLNKINGMFSFAILDKKNNQLFCARDPVGEKPFFYFNDINIFSFASELNALKKILDKNLKLNLESLTSFMTKNVRNISAPNSAYEQINKLRPGHYIIRKLNNDKIEEIPYLKFNYKSQYNETALYESINLSKVSDVKISMLLSGGIDSILISLILKKKYNLDFKSYTIGIDENDPDIINSKNFSSIIGIENETIYFDYENSFDRYKRLILNCGEPIALVPGLLYSDLFEKIRSDGYKVAITGNGADEIFIGYKDINKTIFTYLINKNFKFLSKPFSRISNKFLFLGENVGKIKSSIAKNINNVKEPLINNIYKNYLPDEIMYWNKLLSPNNYIDEHYTSQLFIFHQHSLTHMPDLSGMLNSVEVRAPFLNQNVLDNFLLFNWKKKIFENNYFKINKKMLIKKVLNENLKKYKIDYKPSNKKRGLGYEIKEQNLFKKYWSSEIDNLFYNFDDLDGYLNKSYAQKLWNDYKNNQYGNTEIISKLVSIQIWAQSHL